MTTRNEEFGPERSHDRCVGCFFRLIASGTADGAPAIFRGSTMRASSMSASVVSG